MTIDYHKAWTAMNQLEQIICKISNSLEIMDSATNEMEQGNKTKAIALNYAAHDYLQLILNEFDESFKVAWNETIHQLNQSSFECWDIKIEKDIMNDGFYINLPKNLYDSLNLDNNNQLLWELNSAYENQWIIKKINSSLN